MVHVDLSQLSVVSFRQSQEHCDTCLQVYGFGASEEYLSQFMRDTSTQVVVATKFAPLPWRFTRSTVVDACK